MRIGLIGAGQIGGSLARRLVALGHEVRVANSRGPQTLTELATETGATAVTVTEAARDADLVVVTVPQRSVPQLPAGLLDEAKDSAVVVDTGNYYPQRDGRIAAVEDGMTESRWVANTLGRAVVKAFNGIPAADLLTDGRPAGAVDRRALPVAGDEPRAKEVVIGLLDELGFDGVDAGGLDESWRQQPGTPSYAVRGGADQVRALLAQATPERPSEYLAQR